MQAVGEAGARTAAGGRAVLQTVQRFLEQYNASAQLQCSPLGVEGPAPRVHKALDAKALGRGGLLQQAAGQASHWSTQGGTADMQIGCHTALLRTCMQLPAACGRQCISSTWAWQHSVAQPASFPTCRSRFLPWWWWWCS